MQTLRIVLASLVTLVWLAGYILAYVNGTDQPDGLNVLMGLVLAWVLGGAAGEAIKSIRIERAPEKKADGDEPRGSG